MDLFYASSFALIFSIKGNLFAFFCRCGYEFCYTCGLEWKDKKATCSCPLWDEGYIWYDDGEDEDSEDSDDFDDDDDDNYDYDNEDDDDVDVYHRRY